MDVLAGYASDEEASKSGKCPSSKTNHENGADLEAEWETFQKMIAESPSGGQDEKSNGGSEEEGSQDGGSPGRRSRSPTKKESRKTSHSPSSGSSSASEEESAASGGSSEESSSGSDSSPSPERSKKKKKKRRHSSSCVEDAVKPDEEPSVIDTKDNSPPASDPRTEAKEETAESPKPGRSRHRRSRSRSRRYRKEHRRRPHRRSRSRGRRSRSRDRRRRERSRKEGHRRRRSRSGGRRRSSSRDRKREGRRRRHRRPRSRSPKRRPESRPRSRSRSPNISKKRRNEPLSFKEKLKQSFLEVQKQAAEGRLNIDDLDPDRKGLMSMNEKPSSLPLNSEKPLTAMAMGPSGTVTPQQALLQTMAAMHQKAQELTGVAVPKYYNPAAVNPLKYAEQVQKRKLLWSKKEPKDQQEAPPQMSSEWKAVAYAQDGDSKAAEKFRKLMGIKNQGSEESKVGTSHQEDKSQHTNDMAKKQEELFRNLDKEYEFARMTTHTHRGVGLGFTSHVPYFPK